MSWKIPLSTNTSINLGAGENLYIAKDVDIYVEDDYAIQTDSQSEIVIAGSVISDDYAAVHAGSSGVTPNVITITVTASAHVEALDGNAMDLYAPDCSLDNAGSITSDDTAIALSGDQGHTITITNSGKISADFGIYAATGQTVVLHNSGTIAATDLAYQAGDGGTNINLITNTGRMIGKVEFWLGNDLYDGREGHVNAPVTGDGGNDRIYGGTENNVLDGGSGKDRLWGGGGADSLTGGTGADVFIFKAMGDSTSGASGRDTINDFAHGIDTIDLQAMDANSGAKGDQAFHFIGAQDFHHKAGELHVVRTSGDTVLQGDVNGDGKADFAITLAGHINLSSGDFAL